MPIQRDLRRAFQKFTDQLGIGWMIDEEGERLAENLGINVTQSVRQQRNELDAGLDSRYAEIDLIDASDIELTPQQERNIEASFKTHMKGVLRTIADQVGNDLAAKEFMGLNPDHEPVVLKLHEHAEGNVPLGPHPHSKTLSVPIPPGYEDVAEEAGKRLTIRQRIAKLGQKAKL